MRRLAGTGHHRQHRTPRPVPPEPARILAEAASGDLTIDELREFLDDVDETAAAAGTDPGRLRPFVAVRMSGAAKAIWVRMPARRD